MWSLIIGYLIVAPLAWILSNLHKIIIVVCVLLITMKILEVGPFNENEEDKSKEARQIVSTRI